MPASINPPYRLTPITPLVKGGGLKKFKLFLVPLILCTFFLTACTTFLPGSRSDNLWDRLPEGFELPDNTDHLDVKTQLNWYVKHPAYLHFVATRSTPYVYYILQKVEAKHMPTEIAILPIVESNYDPFAYSEMGAAGLWQMMPGTAAGYRLRQNWWYDGRRDVDASTDAALTYLSYLYEYFDHDWLLAIAAYNCGEGTVQNAIRTNKKLGLPTDFWHLNLPPQTKSYVPKLLALSIIISHPDEYPVNLPVIKMQPYLSPVFVGSQIELSKAAKLAGISVKDMYAYNPGFNRWATDPDGNPMLLLPQDKIAIFKANLAQLPSSERVTWKRHPVQKNETLDIIAKKYKTSVALIIDINGIKNHTIQTGQVLLIPLSQKSFTKEHLLSIKRYLSSSAQLPGPAQTFHQVQKGDNLAKIATTYQVPIASLRAWNHLKVSEPIVPGMELLILNKSRGNASSKTVRPYLLEHTVTSKDSLKSLAIEYHTTVAAIKSLNNLPSDRIKVGQVLTMPPGVQAFSKPKPLSYTVKPGDSLQKIASSFNISTARLKSFNHLKSDVLKLKQVLLIPAQEG